MSDIRIAIPRYRAYEGPALLTAGFRPFFPAAGLWAAIALAGWLYTLASGASLPSHFGPVAWHAHEMLYGFVVASIAGFLLTAVPNWTGRMPLQGLPLLLLALLWLAGRAASATSSWIGAGLAAAADLAFLTVILAVVLREILAGRNWRNLPLPCALSLLLLGNGLMHAEAAGQLAADGAGWRLGLAASIMLISLVGGRIVPSFTRNWLAKRNASRLPAPFGLADKAAPTVTGAAVAIWVTVPESRLLGLIAGLAAIAQACAWPAGKVTGRWPSHCSGSCTSAMPGCRRGSHCSPRPASGRASLTAATHALTGGAIGTMTLAVMTRATLGHTGRALTAGPVTTAFYLLATVAAATRVAPPWRTIRTYWSSRAPLASLLSPDSRWFTAASSCGRATPHRP